MRGGQHKLSEVRYDKGHMEDSRINTQSWLGIEHSSGNETQAQTIWNHAKIEGSKAQRKTPKKPSDKLK